MRNMHEVANIVFTWLILMLTAATITTVGVNDALAFFSFTMDLEQQDNDFLDEPQYDVSPREFTTSGGDTLCPTNDCTFELNDGEFRKNTFSAGYVITGELVAERPSQTEEEGETFSTFHDIRVDLDRMSASESGGIRTEYLMGNMDVAGSDYFVIGNANFTDNEATELKVAGSDISP